MQRNLWLTTTAAGLAFAAAAAVWLGVTFVEAHRLAQPSPLATATRDLWEQASHAGLTSHNQASFESGNIGLIEHPKPESYVLHLRSDNDDALPDWWRQWFYLKLSDVPIGREVGFTITGGGLPNDYLPFYSYDNINWYQFKKGAGTKSGSLDRVFTGVFTAKNVWLARYVPYPYSRLRSFLGQFRTHPAAHLSVIGKSPQGHDVPVLTITAPGEQGGRRLVIIHARTHPGEVASSFVLEGLISFLLGPSPRAEKLRSRLVFTILPMLNVDGVIAGNNRVSPTGVNLEGKWHGLPAPSLALNAALTPPEVLLFHSYLEGLLKSGSKVSMALNLHASAGEPKNQAFSFVHFGPVAHGYSSAEAALYDQQMQLINELAAVQGAAWLEAGSEGGREFLKANMPERWWWDHFGPQVTALTLESTVGLAADRVHWIKPNDLRAFGASVAESIGRVHFGRGLCAAHGANNLVRCR